VAEIFGACKLHEDVSVLKNVISHNEEVTERLSELLYNSEKSRQFLEASLQAIESDFLECSDHNQSLGAENNDLKLQLSSCSRQLKFFQAQSGTQREGITVAEAKIQESAAELEELNKTLEASKTQCMDLEKRLESSQKDFELQLQEQKETLDQMQAQEADLASKLKAAQEDVERLQTEAQESVLQLEETKQALDQRQTQEADLASKLKAAQEDVEKLQTEAQESALQLEEQKRALDQMQSQLEETKQVLDQRQSQEADLASKLKAAQDDLQRFQIEAQMQVAVQTSKLDEVSCLYKQLQENISREQEAGQAGKILLSKTKEGMQSLRSELEQIHDEFSSLCKQLHEAILKQHEAIQADQLLLTTTKKQMQSLRTELEESKQNCDHLAVESQKVQLESQNCQSNAVSMIADLLLLLRKTNSLTENLVEENRQVAEESQKLEKEKEFFKVFLMEEQAHIHRQRLMLTEQQAFLEMALIEREELRVKSRGGSSQTNPFQQDDQPMDGPDGCESSSSKNFGSGKQIHDAERLHIIMTLDLDFKDAGEEGSEKRASFQEGIIADLAMAAKTSPTAFSIKSISPGSIVIDVQVLREQSEGAVNPAAVVADLEQQAKDPGSLLRSGGHTGRLTKITSYEREQGQEYANETQRSTDIENLQRDIAALESRQSMQVADLELRLKGAEEERDGLVQRLKTAEEERDSVISQVELRLKAVEENLEVRLKVAEEERDGVISQVEMRVKAAEDELEVRLKVAEEGRNDLSLKLEVKESEILDLTSKLNEAMQHLQEIVSFSAMEKLSLQEDLKDTRFALETLQRESEKIIVQERSQISDLRVKLEIAEAANSQSSATTTQYLEKFSRNLDALNMHLTDSQRLKEVTSLVDEQSEVAFQEAEILENLIDFSQKIDAMLAACILIFERTQEDFRNAKLDANRSWKAWEAERLERASVFWKLWILAGRVQHGDREELDFMALTTKDIESLFEEFQRNQLYMSERLEALSLELSEAQYEISEKTRQLESHLKNMEEAHQLLGEAKIRIEELEKNGLETELRASQNNSELQSLVAWATMEKSQLELSSSQERESLQKAIKESTVVTREIYTVLQGKLSEEILAKEEALAKFEQMTSELATDKASLAQAREHISVLEAQMTSMASSYANTLETQNSKNKELQHQLNLSQTQRDGEDKKNKEQLALLESQLQEERRSKEAFEDTISLLTKDVEGAMRNSQEGNIQSQELAARLMKSEKEKAVLVDGLEKKVADKEGAAAALKEIFEQERRKCEELQHQLNLSQTQRDGEDKKNKEQVALLESQLQQEGRSKEALEDTISLTKKQVASLESQLREERQSKSALEDTISLLTKNVEGAMRGSQEEQIQNQELAARLMKSEMESAEVKKHYAQSAESETILRMQLESLSRNSRRDVECLLDDLKLLHEELAIAQAQSELCQRDTNLLRNELERVKEEKKQEHVQNQDLASRIEACEEKEVGSLALIDVACSELAKATMEIIDLKANFEKNQREKIESASAIQFSMDPEKERLKSERQTLEMQVQSLQELIKEDAEVKESLQASESAAKSRVAEAEGQLAELERAMLACVAEEARLLEEIQDRENREQELIRALGWEEGKEGPKDETSKIQTEGSGAQV
jgi:chromosome segregation ATPase